MAMKDRMHTGALYLPGDDEIMDRQRLCLDRLYEFNHTRPSETDKRQALMKEMFAELGENCYIEPPFYSNFGGAHVHLGNHVYCNFAVTMVDASDGQVRTYTIKVRRVDKTVEQVRAEMAQEDYTSFVEGTRFYQQPSFRMAVTAGVGGLAVLIVLLAFHARKTARVTDEDEPSFYRPEK